MKFIIISDTRIKGKPIKRGATIELNPDVPDESTTLGMLNHAGRIISVDDTKAVEAFNAEEAASKAADKAKADKAKGKEKSE